MTGSQRKWTEAEYVTVEAMRSRGLAWPDIDKKMKLPKGASCNRMRRYHASDANPPKPTTGTFRCSNCGNDFVSPLSSNGIRLYFRCMACKSTVANRFETAHSVRIG